jgi:hypothetical protein
MFFFLRKFLVVVSRPQVTTQNVEEITYTYRSSKIKIYHNVIFFPTLHVSLSSSLMLYFISYVIVLLFITFLNTLDISNHVWQLKANSF